MRTIIYDINSKELNKKLAKKFLNLLREGIEKNGE